jgi:XTP/dITP diphosphohydrolase
VVLGIADKMRRRNPHVFGDGDPAGLSAGPSTGPSAELSAAEVNEQWQEIKRGERRRRADGAPPSPYDGIAAGLPALLLATKILERRPDAAADLPAAGDTGADLGDRLLALVDEAVAAGVDPEQSLRDAVRRAVR